MDGQSAIQEKRSPIENTETRDTDGAGYRGESYYGIPPVKRSIYEWTIGASYFGIGLAGASQVLSTVMNLVNPDENKSMVRAGRYLALAGALVTPGLYIKDLGAPRKWYHMLRIFRPTSLMSMGGVWALTDFGISCGFSALGQMLEDAGQEKAGRIIARSSGISGLPLGAIMSIYMGTELEETSTPFWVEASPLLSPLFGFNSASNALAAFEIAGRNDSASEETVRGMRLLSIGTEMAEVILLRLIENRWTAPARRSSRYRYRYNLLYRTGIVTLGKLVGIAMRGMGLLGGPKWSGFGRFAPFATLTTGFVLPNVILFAGNRSADRPQDYFSLTSQSQSRVAANIEPKTPHSSEKKKIAKRRMITWLGLGLAAGAAAALAFRKK